MRSPAPCESPASCNDEGLSTADGLARACEVETAHGGARHSRREWLKTVAQTGAIGAGVLVVSQNGGEFIDNLHKTMLGYARRFGLQLEDASKAPGEVAYYFGGRHIAESAVVDEFREFVAAMRTDLRRLSSEVTALSHTEFDRAVDCCATTVLYMTAEEHEAAIRRGEDGG